MRYQLQAVVNTECLLWPQEGLNSKERIYDVDVRQVLFNMVPEQALSGRQELRGILQK